MILSFGWMLLLSMAAPVAGSPIEEMRASLRDLMSHQEVFYSEHLRYAGEVDVLKEYKAREGVTVRIVGIHPRFQGYTAEATSPALDGKSCVFWVGTDGTPVEKTKRDQKSGEQGRVACDAE